MEVEYFVNRPITPEQFVELLNQGNRMKVVDI
ncbi:Acetyltransferase [Vibrio cholerae]|nr:Acetyltransferase [Vibrio cholerae]